MGTNKTRFMIIAYDISDPRRLYRIAKVMKDYAVRVQYSIFEAYLDPRSFSNMKQRVEAEMNLEEDSVRFYILCDNCESNIDILGAGEYTERENIYEIL